MKFTPIINHFLTVSIFACLFGTCVADAHAQQLPVDNRKPNDNKSLGWQVAKEYFDQVEKAKPIVRQGILAVHDGKLAYGETKFREALRICNHDAQTWLLLADVFEKQYKTNEALNAYHAVVFPQGWGSSINSHITTRMKYVLALLNANRWPEAVTVYEMAMKSSVLVDGQRLVDEQFNPNRRNVSRLKGIAHLVVGTQPPSWSPPNVKDQLKHLEAAAKLLPNESLVRFEYGKTLEKTGNKSAAAAEYKAALSHADNAFKATIVAAQQRVAQSK